MAGFSIAGIKGLTAAAAREVLKTTGPNELPSARPRSIFAIGLEVVREPMLLLLVAGGAIYLLLGDLQGGLLLLGFVFVVIGITLFQERKTENAIQALRSLSSPRARVIRDGSELRIPGREVVCGDSVIISEGDRVPADGIVLTHTNLQIDESLLTGEAIAVSKTERSANSTSAHPGGEGEPFVYSGTLVVRGQALIEIQKTGMLTEMGKIGSSLQSIKVGKTDLQVQTGKLVRNLAFIGIALSLLVVVAYGLSRGDWLQGLLAGVALAMAMLPEEFPVILTIFLAMGAWRISQKHVLARRMPAIEILGSATVLCVDKTGTLTMNQMAVRQLEGTQAGIVLDEDLPKEVPNDLHELIEFSILASQRDPFDPMEKAFHQLGEIYLHATDHLHADWTLVQEYPLSQELLAMSQVWKSNQNESHVIAAKGAPEAIFDLCHLSPEQIAIYSVKVSQLAENGLRVLGVARASIAKESVLPNEQHDFTFEYLGLVGLVDPVRKSVPSAIQECYEAGIRIIMITGDYPATAQTIAKRAGLRDTDQLITGDELEAMADDELQKRVQRVTIFARVVPEQKLRIVQALKLNGEVVAMTGDGVNDAPAIKAADIGISMGGRGTDVAREASSLVLLNDDFASIVSAIRLGRRIYDNLKKAMAYTFAVHVPIAGLSLIPVLFGWPLMLMPIHIVFMELIIDPACSTVFEAETSDDNVMKRPPRKSTDSLFNRRIVVWSLVQGLVVLATSLSSYLIGLRSGLGIPESRALAFTTLIVGNLALIVTNVSWTRSFLATIRSKNKAMQYVVFGASIFLAAVLVVPAISDVFRFKPIGLYEVIACIGAGIGSVVWFELPKWYMARQRGKRKTAST